MAHQTNTQKTDCLPDYMEDTLLAEMMTELAAIKPEEFTWADTPIGEDEKVLGYADEYAQRLLTLRNDLADRHNQVRQNYSKTQAGSQEECAVNKQINITHKMYEACDALLWGHLYSKYYTGTEGGNSVGLRAGKKIVSTTQRQRSALGELIDALGVIAER